MSTNSKWISFAQTVIAVWAITNSAASAGGVFSESFNDADLTKPDWYDGNTFRIAGDAKAGAGCIEYEWTRPDAGVSGSSGVRHLFEPSDEVWIRFCLKLSKD